MWILPTLFSLGAPTANIRPVLSSATAVPNSSISLRPRSGSPSICHVLVWVGARVGAFHGGDDIDGDGVGVIATLLASSSLSKYLSKYGMSISRSKRTMAPIRAPNKIMHTTTRMHVILMHFPKQLDDCFSGVLLVVSSSSVSDCASAWAFSETLWRLPFSISGFSFLA